MTPVDGLCFIFVCQAGELETKALLLAASLRRYLPAIHEIFAAVPQPEADWGRLSPATIATLERLEVRIVPIVNRIDPGYPIGNKIDCLSIPTDRAAIVFLDSDMLLLREADFTGLLNVPIGAVPASFAPARSEDWARCYKACGLAVPNVSMHTLVSREPTVPYFNAGFVVADRIYAGPLADEWAACALRLRALHGLPAVLRDRFLDQVALPIAAARLGIAITVVPCELNFPSWSLTIGDGPVPTFYHYQNLSRLMREPLAQEALFALIESDGGVGNAVLAAVRGTG